MKNKYIDTGHIIKIKNLLFSNKSIVENYFFMTLLQVLNSFFYILIYPYLIRVLGAESYGLYVYITSIVSLYLHVINFGMDLPATKEIVHNIDNHNEVENILSSVFTIKTVLFVFVGFIMYLILSILSMFDIHFKKIYFYTISYLALYANILFPQWFFQGIQKMKIVTYIQLGIKILTLPLIFLLVKSSKNLSNYFIITSLGSLLGGGIAFLLIKRKYKIKFKPILSTVKWLKIGQPFFYNNIFSTIKLQSVPIIVGTYFDMKEVAVYDLAYKLIILPQIFLSKINDAIFPKVVLENNKNVIKRIIKIEYIVGICAIAFVVIFGKLFISLLGGSSMQYAYFVSVALSPILFSWLVIGAYLNFVFIPEKRYYYVTFNQIVALVSFFVYSVLGLYFYKDIITFALAISFSGFTEILFCVYMTKKYKFL